MSGHMTYVAIIPAIGAVRYLVQVLRPSGKLETTGGFTSSLAASDFIKYEYPGAIELGPGEFYGVCERQKLAVAHV